MSETIENESGLSPEIQEKEKKSFWDGEIWRAIKYAFQRLVVYGKNVDNRKK